jgi:hypothetical protein
MSKPQILILKQQLLMLKHQIQKHFDQQSVLLKRISKEM